MSKKVLIIGAGISGLVAAYIEAKKGNKVEIFDSEDRAGGLLKSYKFANNYFDIGTHFISPTGIDFLDNFLLGDLDENDFNIQNIVHNSNYFQGKLSNISGYVNSHSLEEKKYLQGCLDLIHLKDLEYDSLEHFTLSKFGLTFYEEIFKKVYLKYFHKDPKLISHNMSNFYETNRLIAFSKEISSELTKSCFFDDRLGHQEKINGSTNYYPKKGGMSFYIDTLIIKLSRLGVKFHFNSSVEKVNLSGKGVKSIIVKGKNINLDRLVWSLPAPLLMIKSGKSVKSTPPHILDVGLYAFLFQRPLLSDSQYINVYEPSFFSGRVTLYQNMTKQDIYTCSVEVLTDSSDNLPSADIIISELLQMGIITEKNLCKSKDLRIKEKAIPVFSNQNIKDQEKLLTSCKSDFINVNIVGQSAEQKFSMISVIKSVYKILKNE